MKTRLACILAVTLLVPVTAIAHRQSLADGRDSKSDVDIKWARLSHTATKVTFRVRTYSAMPRNAEPCIDMRVGRKKYLAGCGPTPKMISKVDFDHPEAHRIGFSRTAKTVTYVVKRKFFGNPRSFRWRAAFFEEDRAADAAPNKGFKKHAF
jgi:hypothetical protein